MNCMEGMRVFPLYMDKPSLYVRCLHKYRRLLENEKQVHAVLIRRFSDPGRRIGASASLWRRLEL